MSIKRVDLVTLNKWINDLTQKERVIGVQAKGDRFAFAPLAKAADLRLDYDVTILPPKAFFQPSCETLSTYNKKSGYQSVIEDKPFVLFGVHPYDMVAIMQMDAVFSQGNYDEHYMARRRNATIVVVDVYRGSPNVFAGAMGTSHVEDGYDVLITKIGDEYLVDGKTPAGGKLMAGLAGAPDAGESWIEQRKMVWEYNKQRLRRHDLKAAPSTWPKLLENGYDNPIWEERAKLCYSCGSCVLVCPTCYCFDVKDETGWDLSSGERVRVWDGCMLTNFATVAGDHNFRKEKAARFRHRYLRKGKYVPSKIGGKIACVGCGRCVTACTSKIDNPVDVFNRLAEGEK